MSLHEKSLNFNDSSCLAQKLRVLDIVPGTTVDGPGMRTSIYFAGCKHHCPGCHNPQSWDLNGGEEMTVREILEVVKLNDFNVTFSGGDPFFQPTSSLVALAKAIISLGYSIWCYTGYLYDDIRQHPLIPYLEVLVDGRFIEAQRDISLLFRGSANQRLIDVHRSTPEKVVFWKSLF